MFEICIFCKRLNFSYFRIIAYQLWIIIANLKYSPCTKRCKRVVNVLMHILSRVCASYPQCTHLIASVHVYKYCTYNCAQIFKKFFLVVKYYFMSYSLKFYKDPSFRWGDIALLVTLYNLEVKMLGFFHTEL